MGAMRDFLRFVIVLVFLTFNPDTTSAQSIAPDVLISTAQVIVKSCYFPGVSSEKVAWKFFGCYDYAPGKELFVRCQKSTFNGVLFNSVKNIQNNCSQPLKIPPYVRCIRMAFQKSGLDMNSAVRKLNTCQLALFN